MQSNTIDFRCPKCHADFRAPIEWAGKRANCKTCGAAVNIPSPMPASTSGPAFYVLRGDERFGPYTPDELKGMAESGEIRRDDFIWRDGLKEWILAGSIAKLFPPSNPTPPAIPEAAVAHAPSTSPQNQPNESLRATGMFRVACPHCKSVLDAPDSLRGQDVDCPICKQRFCVSAVSNGETLAPSATGAREDINRESVLLHEPGVSASPNNAPFQGIALQRRLTLVAASVGMISVFLPWVHVPLVGAVRGTTVPVGWAVFALFVSAAILSLAGNRTAALSRGARLGVSIPAALATILLLLQVYGLQVAKSEKSMEAAFAKASQVGMGIFLGAIAGFALVLLALWYERLDRLIKTGKIV